MRNKLYVKYYIEERQKLTLTRVDIADYISDCNYTNIVLYIYRKSPLQSLYWYT